MRIRIKVEIVIDHRLLDLSHRLHLALLPASHPVLCYTVFAGFNESSRFNELVLTSNIFLLNKKFGFNEYPGLMNNWLGPERLVKSGDHCMCYIKVKKCCECAQYFQRGVPFFCLRHFCNLFGGSHR